MKLTVKEKISNSFFMSIRILGSAWLSFLVSIAPLFIWRGTNPGNDVGEEIIMSVIGVFFGFLFLMLFQARDNKSYRCSMRDVLLISCGGIGIYMLVWIIWYLTSKNNYLIAVLGYHLSCLIGIGTDGYPAFFASLVSALIFGGTYFLANLVGTKVARKRYQRFLKE